MGSIGRAIGTLAFTIGGSLLGPAGFATFGAALGSFSAGLLFGQKGGVSGFRLSDLEGETLDYGAPINRFYGVMKTTGMPIDARQNDGKAQAIEETKTTKTKGGIFGFGGTKVTEYTYKLYAAYLLGYGQYEVERWYYEDGKGRKIKYNRAGETEDERGYTLTNVTVGGQLVGEISDELELWRGYPTQPASTYLLSQHPDGVPAYRGYSYMVIKGLDLPDGLGKVIAVIKDLSGTNTRKRVIETTFTEGGVPLSRVWLEGLSQPISAHSTGGGAVLSGGAQRSDFIAQMAILGLCDLPQVDGVIQDRPRQSPLYHVLQLDELGARPWSSGDGNDSDADNLKIQPVNVRELPSSLRINFQDINLDYATNYAISRRETAEHENEQTLDLPIASTLPEMQWLADTLLDEAWAARATVEVNLLPSRIGCAVGDILLIPDDGDLANPVVHSVRITEQTLSPEGVVACKGAFYDGGVYGQYRPIEPVVLPVPAIERALAPSARLWDIPAIEDGLVSACGVLWAACAPPGTYWAGAVGELQNAPATIDPVLIESQSIMGRVLTAHTFTPLDRATRIDGVTLRVELDYGGLSPAASETAIRRDFANSLAVQSGGDVLMLQFYDAVPVSGQPTQWDISGLLVGKHATDALVISTNAPCMLLRDSNGKAKDGPVWLDLPTNLRGTTLSYRTYTNDSRARFSGTPTLAFNGETLVPRSPTVSSAVLEDDGTLTLKGRARTRYNDDGQKAALAHRLSEPPTAQGYHYQLRKGSAKLDLFATDPRASFDFSIPASFIGSSHSAALSLVGDFGPGHETVFTF